MSPPRPPATAAQATWITTVARVDFSHRVCTRTREFLQEHYLQILSARRQPQLKIGPIYWYLVELDVLVLEGQPSVLEVHRLA